MFEQERVLTRLQQAVLREPTIQVCVLIGSFGRRTHDDWADIDVLFAFESEAARTAAYAHRADFTQAVLTYVAVKAFEQAPHHYMALYANGTKVDYHYALFSELTPTAAWREVRLLKDWHTWGENFIAACQNAPLAAPPFISAAELEALDHRFWVLLWEVYRQLRRGDYDRPFVTYLHLLHETLPTLLHLLPSTDPAHQGLLQVAYGPDAGRNLSHLRPLLAAYVQARSAVVRQYRLIFTPNSGFEQSITKLMDK